MKPMKCSKWALSKTSMDLEHTPKSRQLALFSATMPSAILRGANQHLDRPEHVKIEAKTTTVERISQKFIQAPQHHKLEITTNSASYKPPTASLSSPEHVKAPQNWLNN